MEKDYKKQENHNLTYGRGYVHSLQYHIVWCTKYRRKVLVDGTDEDCKVLLHALAEEYKFRILAMEVMRTTSICWSTPVLSSTSRI